MIGVLLVYLCQNKMEHFVCALTTENDCIDNIGQAKYVMKLDLLKRFLQIPLTDRAK